MEEIMADLDHYLGELGEEMRGISEYWGIDPGIIVGLNFAYELRRVRLTVPCYTVDGLCCVPVTTCVVRTWFTSSEGVTPTPPTAQCLIHQ